MVMNELQGSEWYRLHLKGHHHSLGKRWRNSPGRQNLHKEIWRIVVKELNPRGPYTAQLLPLFTEDGWEVWEEERKVTNAKEYVLPISLFLGFVSLIFFFFFCRLPRTAFGVLVPWARTESMPLALEAWSLNHWITREIPIALILVSITSQLPISHFSLLSLPFALHLIPWNLEPVEPAGMFSLKSCSPWTLSTQGKGNYIFFPFTSKWLI